jgi:hypothetical protein
VASIDDPDVRPVHHGARLERDERLDLADRGGPEDDSELADIYAFMFDRLGIDYPPS